MQQQQTARSTSWPLGRTGRSPRAPAAITLSRIPVCEGTDPLPAVASHAACWPLSSALALLGGGAGQAAAQAEQVEK